MQKKLAYWWRAYPPVAAALAAISGVLIADLTAPPVRLVLSCLLFATGLFFCPPLARWRVLLLPTLLACLFAFLHARQLATSAEHPLRLYLAEASQAQRSTEAILTARILQTTRAQGDRLQAVLWVEQVHFPASGVTLTQPAKVTTLLSPNTALDSATWLTCRGRLRALRTTQNLGQFDPASFALRQGLIASFDLDYAEPAAAGHPWNWPTLKPLRDLADACRNSIQHRLAVGLEDQSDRLTVIHAMVLGASEDTDPRIEDAFRRSGTLHVFAVSGLHVGLIGVIGWTLLRPFIGLRRHQMILLVIALVVSYAYVTGWRPSAARAAIMITVLLAASLVQRQSLLINGMGLAALLLLWVDTQQLFLVGFQLSFGVLLAIYLLAGRFLTRMEPWTEFDPFLPPALANSRQRFWRHCKRYLAGLIAVSVAAWLGSLPLMIYHFQTVTPAALLANCLLVPLAFLCLGSACLSLLLSLLPLAGPQIFMNQICGLFAHWMLLSASTFSQLPGGNLHLALPSTSARLAPVELRIFALPSGGEAALLNVHGHHWLLDCGHQNTFAPTVLPGLRTAGVNRLDGIVLSHSDADHIGATHSILQQFPTHRLFHPLHEPWLAESSATRMRQLLEHNLPNLDPSPQFTPLQRGDVVSLSPKLHPARLTALYPTPNDRHPVGDDRGLVSSIELGHLRLLWLADAGFVTETALLNRKEDIRCDILLHGLHANDISGTYDFLAAAAPRLIIAYGIQNDPTLRLPQSIRRYAQDQNIPLLTLPDSGGIQLILNQSATGQVTIKTFSTKEHHQLPLYSPTQPHPAP
jgi:competence protein ComEC